MDNFEILSVKAYKEEKIDKNNNIIDKYYYLKLKDLCLNYRCGKITQGKAEIRKKKLKNNYNYEMGYYKRYIAICKEYNDNRIKIEYNLSQIEKSNDKNEILKLSLEIISKMINDEEFLKRNLNKLTF